MIEANKKCVAHHPVQHRDGKEPWCNYCGLGWQGQTPKSRFDKEKNMTHMPPSNDWMQTFSGRAFFPLNLEENFIDEMDIAHSLSMQCRYNGHVDRFYSVAEHCVHMSYVVPEEDALWALLHDATEAYVGDMVRPLKKHMTLFVEIEDKIMDLVCEKFKLHQNFMPDSVKEADNRIIENERLALLKDPPYPWTVHGEPLPNVEIKAWDPVTAKFKYYARLQELLQDREVREATKLAEMAGRIDG